MDVILSTGIIKEQYYLAQQLYLLQYQVRFVGSILVGHTYRVRLRLLVQHLVLLGNMYPVVHVCHAQQGLTALGLLLSLEPVVLVTILQQDNLFVVHVRLVPGSPAQGNHPALNVQLVHTNQIQGSLHVQDVMQASINLAQVNLLALIVK